MKRPLLIRALTTAAVAAAVALTASAQPAAAAPTSWKWGAIRSTDGMATAWGKVVVGQSGLAVTGNLDDTYGKGCSWAVIKYQSARNGRWRTHGIYNCVPGTGTFRKNVGGVLQIRIQVCRGTATRPTGKCSRWRTVWTQGG
ncbi:hypothetical protein SMD20_07135 [Nonomuraea sp. LP-02]|uniref:hypothetical protein n=1 Tax=Nonomuraea sp. LP-02 TaxID=3097960 RepID=UPI002E30B9BE|nr:hypothetical protein [Nonomuraea sp. LP-02]MED7923997.1 hypothetical protein [Nonomuraea sp. LP-02]